MMSPPVFEVEEDISPPAPDDKRASLSELLVSSCIDLLNLSQSPKPEAQMFLENAMVVLRLYAEEHQIVLNEKRMRESLYHLQKGE